MKLYNIVNCYKTLEPLADNDNFSNADQLSMFSLRKTLRPHVEFYNERIGKLEEKYTKFADENGNITGEPYKNYMHDLLEINNMDIDENFSKITLPVVKGINFITMEFLEDFVDFIL